MPFGNFFPNLPLPFVVIMFDVIGFMGSLALIYSVYLESEKRKDAVIMVAAASLFVYAALINNKMFMFAFAGMFLVSTWEFIHILRGTHRHTRNDALKK